MQTIATMPLDDENLKGVGWFLGSIFLGSSVAGWAYLLWQNKGVSPRQKIGGVVMSGFAGIVVALLLWEKLADQPTFLAGVSLLAGIGGASTVDLLLALFYRRVGGREGQEEKR